MSNKFLVDRIAEDTIRVYPEKQPEASAEDCPVRKRRVTLMDYGKDHGFSISPNIKNQKGTVFKVKDFPCCTLHKSKTKFFIHLSFSKATLEDAKRIIKRDQKEWFDFFTKLLEEEAAASPEAEPEKSEKRKVKSKAKTQKTKDDGKTN